MNELLEIPPLPNTTILMVEVGSTAHGTGIEGGEDHDELAVVVETPEQLMGLDEHGFKTVMQRTQPEGAQSGPGDTDRTLHSLRRFLRLAASGNPSILMTMWAPVEFATDEGRELQALGDAFIGRHVVPRYRGYMQSQVKRLLGEGGGGHGVRGSGGRPELIEQFGYDTKYAMHAARLGFQCIELLSTGGLTLPIPSRDGDWLRDVRYGRVEFDEWFERTVELDAALEALLEDESVPPGPDRKRIDAWSVETHQAIWAASDRTVVEGLQEGTGGAR